MSADLYAAWLTAGNNLQPAGNWLAGNWWWIAAVVAGVFAAWAIRRCLRDANETVTAILADLDDQPTQHRTGEK